MFRYSRTVTRETGLLFQTINFKNVTEQLEQVQILLKPPALQAECGVFSGDQ